MHNSIYPDLSGCLSIATGKTKFKNKISGLVTLNANATRVRAINDDMCSFSLCTIQE